jgi:hypothetical protein
LIDCFASDHLCVLGVRGSLVLQGVTLSEVLRVHDDDIRGTGGVNDEDGVGDAGTLLSGGTSRGAVKG